MGSATNRLTCVRNVHFLMETGRDLHEALEDLRHATWRLAQDSVPEDGVRQAQRALQDALKPQTPFHEHDEKWRDTRCLGWATLVFGLICMIMIVTPDSARPPNESESDKNFFFVVSIFYFFIGCISLFIVIPCVCWCSRVERARFEARQAEERTSFASAEPFREAVRRAISARDEAIQEEFERLMKDNESMLRAVQVAEARAVSVVEACELDLEIQKV